MRNNIPTSQGTLAQEDNPSSAIMPIAEDMSIEFQQILLLLRKQTGYNFSLYKPNTISRQIQKRLHTLQIDTLPEYIYFLSPVSYTHLRAHETRHDIVCRLLL